MIRRRTRPMPIERRRSGPPGERRWWDPTDQHAVEGEPIVVRSLGRGWRRFPMLNNLEVLDPHGPGPEADRLREIRVERELTALDEGTAFRNRSTGSLLVLRSEVFAREDPRHRSLWQQLAPIVLTETWRHRWSERDREPGWIEARWMPDADPDAHRPDDLADATDWIRIEDHTGEGDDVVVYHHVSVWIDRMLATLTLRMRLGEPVDPALWVAVRAVRDARVSRRSDPAPGSA